MSLSIFVKKNFRSVYYYFFNNRIVALKGYEHLTDYKWIADKHFGMAYYTGKYEPPLCQYLLQNISLSSVFVDIGSHAGYFSLFAAAIAKEGFVYSFEPDKHNCNFIERIIDLNGFTRWNLIPKAVGKEKGSVFFETGSSSSLGKVVTNGTLKVPVTCLDEEVKNLDRIDVIKIDVEGFGGRVLEGGLKAIRRFKPKIMMEIHNKSDELKTLFDNLSVEYEFKDLHTGATVKNVNQKVDFIIAEPKKDS